MLYGVNPYRKSRLITSLYFILENFQTCKIRRISDIELIQKTKEKILFNKNLFLSKHIFRYTRVEKLLENINWRYFTNSRAHINSIEPSNFHRSIYFIKYNDAFNSSRNITLRNRDWFRKFSPQFDSSWRYQSIFQWPVLLQPCFSWAKPWAILAGACGIESDKWRK